MNKGQLKDAVAEAAGLSGADAERALEAVLDTITSTVAQGEKVTIPGFGTFEPRERSARTGRNPQTGAEIQIAASTVPGFKAGAAFKSAVAGSWAGPRRPAPRARTNDGPPVSGGPSSLAAERSADCVRRTPPRMPRGPAG